MISGGEGAAGESLERLRWLAGAGEATGSGTTIGTALEAAAAGGTGGANRAKFWLACGVIDCINFLRAGDAVRTWWLGVGGAAAIAGVADVATSGAGGGKRAGGAGSRGERIGATTGMSSSENEDVAELCSEWSGGDGDREPGPGSVSTQTSLGAGGVAVADREPGPGSVSTQTSLGAGGVAVAGIMEMQRVRQSAKALASELQWNIS